MSSTERASGETRKAAIIAAINLTVSLATVGVLVFYQVPLFDADRKLKELDGSIREIEKSLALQKNTVDLLRDNIGSAESAMKLIENLGPKSFIKIEKSDTGTGFAQIIWTIENRGAYSFIEKDDPEFSFSRKPITDSDDRPSDPDLKILYRSTAMQTVAPNTSQFHTARIARPAGLSTIYWRIKIKVETAPNVVQLAKKLLPETFHSDIEDTKFEFRTFYGTMTISDKSPSAAVTAASAKMERNP